MSDRSSGHSLIRFWYGEEHKDGARSGKDREEPEDPTPRNTGNSHITSDQRGKLSSTASEGYALNNDSFGNSR